MTEQEFWSHVERGEGCWLWRAAIGSKGYGRLRFGGRVQYAHRVAYALAVGPIPTGMHLCHSCDNPPCVNPAHLRPGTRTDNMQDMVTRRRHRMQRSEPTHCKRGHPLSGENVYNQPGRIRSDGKPNRACRECGQMLRKRWRQQRRVA